MGLVNDSCYWICRELGLHLSFVRLLKLRRTQKDSPDWVESAQECLQQVPSQTICSESEQNFMHWGPFSYWLPRSHPMNDLFSPRLTVYILSTMPVGANRFILVFLLAHIY